MLPASRLCTRNMFRPAHTRFHARRHPRRSVRQFPNAQWWISRGHISRHRHRVTRTRLSTREIARSARFTRARTRVRHDAPSRALDDAPCADAIARRGSRDRARERETSPATRAGLCGSPEQIRTAVTALRGRRPRPLDDGADACVLRARGGGLEPPKTGPEPAVLPITPPPKGGGQVSGPVPAQLRSRSAETCARGAEPGERCARGRAAASSRTAASPRCGPSTAA